MTVGKPKIFLAGVAIVAGLAGAYLFAREVRPRAWLFKKRLVHLASDLSKHRVFAALTGRGDRYRTFPFTGKVREAHPRILFPPEAGFEFLRARYASDKAYRQLVDAQSRGQDLLDQAMAWACRGDRAAGRRGVEQLLRRDAGQPNDEGAGGQGLTLALGYDLLGNLPDWDPAERRQVEEKLAAYARAGLSVLDGSSASLWHGRSQLAFSVWVVAVALDGPPDGLGDLRRRAQAHLFASLEAIATTEGWPEGYLYWINNRAFPFAVACAAHVNAVEAPEVNRRILALVQRVALWTIHGTEPIGRFVLFGDTGPRNDLRDETQRVVDLFALLTCSPVYGQYSRYLAGSHKGYYFPYRWGVPILRGPRELDFGPTETVTSLAGLQGRLPASAVFGRGSLGQVFLRSDWGPDATFISFQAGHALAHHGHYQAGHFTITKKAPLAISSGTYGDYFGKHRLNYYIRTVAANGLLVLRPGEKVQPNRLFHDNVAEGGQRLTMPTGSAIVSVQDWRDNLGKGRHYEGGEITAFENGDDRFVYVGSDLTGAYNSTRYDDNGNGGKVSRVSRQLVYLRGEDSVILHDRVAATDGRYAKKWLLHSWGKPQTASERVLVGRPDDGILESADSLATIRHGGGELQVLKLLPGDGVVRKVGGPHYRYYVEADGDDSDLDGANMDAGANEQPWFDAGLWRIEIQPRLGRREDRFLVVLKPSVEGESVPLRADIVKATALEGVVTERSVVLFGTDGPVSGRLTYQVPAGGRRLHVLADVPRDRTAAVSFGGSTVRMRATGEGVLAFEAPAGTKSLTVDFGH